MDIIAFKMWIGELFNKNNSLKARLIRFFIRERYLKAITLFFLGFNNFNKKNENYNSLKTKGFLRLPSLTEMQLKKIKDEIKLLNFIPNTKDPVLQIGSDLLDVLENKNKLLNLDYQIYRNTNVINEAQTIKEIAFNKDITGLVSDYLGTKNFIVDGQIWFTFNDGKAKISADNHNFGWHYDIDDLHWVKVFIYLNDVDELSGPHEFIEDSHLLSGFKKIVMRRVENEKKFKNIGLNESKIITFTGQAGTTFIEDTFGYHRGLDPVKNRAILQFTYRVGIIQ